MQCERRTATEADEVNFFIAVPEVLLELFPHLPDPLLPAGAGQSADDLPEQAEPRPNALDILFLCRGKIAAVQKPSDVRVVRRDDRQVLVLVPGAVECV